MTTEAKLRQLEKIGRGRSAIVTFRLLLDKLKIIPLPVSMFDSDLFIKKYQV
jgi:hypothetical protein